MWPPTTLSSRVRGLSEGLQFITCPVFEKGAPRASLLSLGRSSCLSSNLYLFQVQDAPLPHSAHPGFTGGDVRRGRTGKSCTVYIIQPLTAVVKLFVNNKGIRHLLLLNTCSIKKKKHNDRATKSWSVLGPALALSDSSMFSFLTCTMEGSHRTHKKLWAATLYLAQSL